MRPEQNVDVVKSNTGTHHLADEDGRPICGMTSADKVELVSTPWGKLDREQPRCLRCAQLGGGLLYPPKDAQQGNGNGHGPSLSLSKRSITIYALGTEDEALMSDLVDMLAKAKTAGRCAAFKVGDAVRQEVAL